MSPTLEILASTMPKSVHSPDRDNFQDYIDTNDEDESEQEEDEEEDDENEEEDEDSDTRCLHLSQDDSLDCTLDEDDENDPLVDLLDVDCPKSVEKSVIIHRDDNGFGLKLKGQSPVLVENVQENGAAWKAGVRRLDRISKVNGIRVEELDHREVVAMLKSCSRFVGLTILTSQLDESKNEPDNSCKQIVRPKRHLSSASSSASASCLFERRRNNSIAILPDNRAEQKIIDQASDFETSSYKQAVRRKYSTQDSPNLVEDENESCTNTYQLESAKSLRSPSIIQQNEPAKLLANMHITDQYQSVTCSTCQAPIDMQTSSELDRQLCSGCRLEVQSNLSLAVTSMQKSKNIALRRTQKTHMSLRDPRQSQIASSSGETRKVQTVTNPRISSYRLSQSASTNSLPNDKTKISPSSQVSLSRQPTTVNKRLEIIRELIDTEKTHTDKLKCLDELFYQPLRDGQYMTPEQLRSVFSCHRTLYKIHRQIYRILLSANYGIYSEPLIGSALIEIFEGPLRKRLERAACSFCSSQATNTELLNKITRKDSRIGDFLAQVTNQQMVGRLGIKDLLASCFQRLTKYPLLLENLLRATPEKPTESDLANKFKSTLTNSSTISARLSESFNFEDQNRGDTHHEDMDSIQARRMLALSLAEEREFIQRALNECRKILFKVNDSIRVAMSRMKLREIWKRTDKYPGVPTIDISKQQVVHEGFLTLRLSKRSFDVYMLLLNDYIIILTREGQDKYRLKFFSPEGKFAVNSQAVYSPIFIIDEHLATRDAATDENGFYLLCKRKDDSRIYEFASRSPAERLKWRDRIQWTIERRTNKGDRRPSSKYSSLNTQLKVH